MRNVVRARSTSPPKQLYDKGLATFGERAPISSEPGIDDTLSTMGTGRGGRLRHRRRSRRALLLWARVRLSDIPQPGPIAGWQSLLTDVTVDGRPIEPIGPLILGAFLDYRSSEDERTLRFHPAPPPDPEELERVLQRLVRRIVRVIERRGLGDEPDRLTEDDPLRG